MATRELSAADTTKTTMAPPSHRFHLLPAGPDEWEGARREGSFSQEGVQQSRQGWGSGQGHRRGHGRRLTHLLRCADLASAAGCPQPACPKPGRAAPPAVVVCLQPGSALRPPGPGPHRPFPSRRASPFSLRRHTHHGGPLPPRRPPCPGQPARPQDGRPGAPRAAPNMATACECRGGPARR